MIHVKHSWLALGIMTALAGCMSEGGGNDGQTGGDIMTTNGSGGTSTGSSTSGTTGSASGGSTAGSTGDTPTNGGGNTDGSNTDGNSGGQTGGTPTTGGTGTGTTGSTDPDGGATGGGTTGYIVPPSECGADASGKPKDTSAQGGCYYFYCYTNLAGLKASAKPGGACAGDKDLAIQCEGESVRSVSQCARQNAILAGFPDMFRKAVSDCARKVPKLAEMSDACLACNVESSVCAAGACVGDCVAGDSKACDMCREKNGCTPKFYECGGLPDPMKL